VSYTEARFGSTPAEQAYFPYGGISEGESTGAGRLLLAAI